jgi:two-component system, LuxR family, sensor kinase FixL
MADVQYRLDAGSSHRTTEQTNRLLKEVSEIQLRFIRASEAVSWFEEALQAFLNFTGSTYGFIGDVKYDEGGAPQLQIRAASHSVSAMAWQNTYESMLPDAARIRELRALSSEALRSGTLQISNASMQNSQSDGLPADGQSPTAVMAIPLQLGDQLIGIVGIANRPTGYNTALFEWLEPLRTTCSALIIATKNEQDRTTAAIQTSEQQQQLQMILDSVNARVFYLDVDGQVVRHNLLSQEATGLSSGDCIGKPIEEISFRVDNATIGHDQSLDVIRSGKPLLGQLVSYSVDSVTRWASVDRNPTFDTDGLVNGLRVFACEVTDFCSATRSHRNTESQLSLLLDQIPAVLWSVDRNHVFTLAAGKALAILGQPSEEIVGSTLQEQFGTDDPASPPIARHLRALQGESLQYEVAWGGRNFECRLEPVRDDDGDVSSCLGVALDVTERVHSETERLKAEEQWRAVVHNVPDFILVVGRDGQIQFLNHLLDGHDKAEVLQSTIFDYQPVDAHNKVRDALRRVFEHGESVSYETVGRGKLDEWRTYVCRLVPMSVSGSEPAALMIATDVTDERVARESEARQFALLKAVTEGTSELIFAKDLDSRPVFVNQAVASLFGTTPEQLIENFDGSFFSEAVQEQIAAADRRIMQAGEPETFEQTLPFPSGDRTFLTTKCPWRDSDGEIIGVIGVSRDVTEWNETKSELHDSRERLRAIIESTPECVKVIAADGALLEMNAAGLRMIEADSAECVIGQIGFDLISPECREAFIAFHNRVCNGTSGSIQYEIVGLKGTRLWMETHAVPLVLGADGATVHLAISRDITATREAEETITQQQAQLLHVSRLSSMGQMVAVISHEITQPLAAISNFSSACELIAQRPSPDYQKLSEYLASINQQSVRAGQILSRVRDFVRRSDDHRTLCDLTQLVTDTLALVRADLRSHHVTVATSFPDEPACVLADSVQIQQVIVNLISNACEVMESQAVARRNIWISLTVSNETVSVEILDSGPGLADNMQDQLFDPFYTSKNNGMGMGLTICNDIIKSHRGTITAANSQNHGASFRFCLPRPSGATDE